MVLYSAYTTCVSIIMLKFPPQSEVDRSLVEVAMAALSVILLALSLYLNSKAFKDRAQRFKHGYHELQEIEYELSTLAASPETNVAGPHTAELARRYSKVLREVENHSTLDDIRVRVCAGTGLTSRQVSGKELAHYYCWRTLRFCALSLLYIAPMVAAILFYAK